MTAKLFRLPVTATYLDEVVVWAEDEAEAKRLVTEEGYAEGSEHVYSVDHDPDPTIEVEGVAFEVTEDDTDPLDVEDDA